MRAVPLDYLREVIAHAQQNNLKVHMHVAEQPAEVSACVEEYGRTPIALLETEGFLSENFTAVHAIHVTPKAIPALARTGAIVCACPTTEANLGDGFLPVERLLHRSIGICIGSDSNARIDPLEELRELDGIARRQAGRRDVLSIDSLLSIGSDEGAAALGLEEWPAIEIDAAHPQLRGVDEPLCALVHGCSADVVVPC